MSKRLSLLSVTLAVGLMLMTDVVNARDDEPASPLENTERNVRDRNDATLTPEDQLENEADRNVTANIRKIITDDESLSVNAHNVKIITRNGKVTLRGPVDSAAEKQRLHDIAHNVSGVTEVDNQLEVKAP